MKKNMRVVFLTALIFSALTAAVGVSAYADNKVEIETEAGVYGEYLLNEGYEIRYDFGTFFTSYPDGMWCELCNGELYLYGAPKEAGTYQFIELVRPDKTVPWDRIREIYVTVRVAEEQREIEITKHPTEEECFEGGTEIFIAYADYADSMWWRLLSPDMRTSVDAATAGDRFIGLAVEGAYYDTLYLENIPLSLDGWYAQAVFEGRGGPKYTEPALIRVRRLSAPVLHTQPKDTAFQAGEETTLHVLAGSADGGEIRYQWYKADDRSDLRGELLPGENKPDLVLAYSEGVRYYYCEVYAMNGVYRSESVKTECASVTGLKYTPDLPPAPSPEAKEEAEQPSPGEGAENTATAEEIPAASPAPETLPVAVENETAREAEKQTENKLVLSSLLLAGSAVCLGGAVLLIIKQRKNAEK